MKNGVIIPDDASNIPEGTRVEIRKDLSEIKGFTMADLQAIGHPILKEAYPGEFDDINKMLQDERDAEVRMLQESERNPGT